MKDGEPEKDRPQRRLDGRDLVPGAVPIAAVVVVSLLLSGAWYTVDRGERGVVLRNRAQFTKDVQDAVEADNKGPLLIDSVQIADSDEAGRVFQSEAGHLFRFQAGQGSDLLSATWSIGHAGRLGR